MIMHDKGKRLTGEPMESDKVGVLAIMRRAPIIRAAMRTKGSGHQLGFSLIEITIVLGILAVLSGLSIVNYNQYIEKSMRAEAGRLLGFAVREEFYYFTKHGCFARFQPNPAVVPVGNELLTFNGNEPISAAEPCDPARVGSFTETNLRVGRVRYQYSCRRSIDGLDFACSAVRMMRDGRPEELVFCSDYSSSGSCIASELGRVSTFAFEPVYFGPWIP